MFTVECEFSQCDSIAGKVLSQVMTTISLFLLKNDFQWRNETIHVSSV